MSDFLAATPIIAHEVCPVCQPGRDPVAEMLVIAYCTYHQPPAPGLDDTAVTVGEGYLSGQEAGGESNRDWCDLLHRRKERS